MGFKENGFVLSTEFSGRQGPEHTVKGIEIGVGDAVAARYSDINAGKIAVVVAEYGARRRNAPPSVPECLA